MTIIKAGDYVALRDVPDALWKVEETNGGTVDVSNTAFAAYKEAVSVNDVTKHVTKAEAKHIRRKK